MRESCAYRLRKYPIMMVTNGYKPQLICDKQMRWLKHEGLSALYGRLSRHEPAQARLAHRVDDIRTAMLDMLGDAGAQQYPHVARRIRFGGDALALWYARADLMGALAGLHGEQVARTRMVSLSVLFEGTLPKGMMSRPTTLRT